ncbi:MAG TPA: PDZ domain-containing protein, partial [Verrucomicrobiae bacterium]
QPLGTNQTTSPLGTSQNLVIYPAPTLRLAGRALALDAVTSLNLQMAELVSGQECDGILGMNFLSQQAVLLDFDHGSLSWCDQVPDSVRQTFTPLPVTFTHGFYSIQVTVNHSHSLRLMVDTGDNSSLSLNSQDWQTVFGDHPSAVSTITVADAANRISPTRMGVVDQLQVAGLVYTNLHATFIRNAEDPSHVGLGFFKRHTVLLDLPDKVLYLRPGERFAQPDQEDRSGLHLLRQSGATLVYSVDQRSPAAAGGIQPGDQIEDINGQPSNELTLRTIRRLLRSPATAQVTLKIKHGENEFAVALQLHRS